MGNAKEHRLCEGYRVSSHLEIGADTFLSAVLENLLPHPISAQA